MSARIATDDYYDSADGLYSRLPITYGDKAWITLEKRINSAGYQEVFFKWNGPVSTPVVIPRRYYLRYFRNLPWDMVLVHEDSYLRESTYVRRDAVAGISALYFRTKYKVRSIYRIAKVRFWLTFDLWGLAKCTEGGIPSWRDLNIVRKWKGK